MNTEQMKSIVSITKQHLHSSSTKALEWVAIVMMHWACIPSTLAFIQGISNNMPNLEVVLFLWGGLAVYFIKSFMENSRLMIFTNGIGFFMQAILLSMVIYK